MQARMRVGPKVQGKENNSGSKRDREEMWNPNALLFAGTKKTKYDTDGVTMEVGGGSVAAVHQPRRMQ